MTKTITVSYFGGCPTCGRNDGLYMRWTIGSNLFSSWRDETEDEQRGQWAVVGDYQDIKDGALSGRQEEVEDIPF
jgi:hypothetical protein